MKKLLLILAAMAFLAVGCTDDPLQPEGDQTETTVPDNGDGGNGDSGNGEGGDTPGTGEGEGGDTPGTGDGDGEGEGGNTPETGDGEGEGGDTPGIGEGEGEGDNGAADESEIANATSISIADFWNLPENDETLYKISGNIYAISNTAELTVVTIASSPYGMASSHAIPVYNPTWYQAHSSELQFGKVLTILGNRGKYTNQYGSFDCVGNSKFVSVEEYNSPYVTLNQSIVLNPEAGTYNLQVYAGPDTEWTMTVPAGTTVNPSSGTGPATVAFTYPANTDTVNYKYYSIEFTYNGSSKAYCGINQNKASSDNGGNEEGGSTPGEGEGGETPTDPETPGEGGDDKEDIGGGDNPGGGEIDQPTETPKSNRELAFSSASVEIQLGEEFEAPTLSGNKEGVVYTSSNTAVATVDSETGAVTLLGAGETTITATAPETETLLAGSASYTLTVKPEEKPEDTIQTVTLLEFRSLSVSDKVYRISGVIWEVDEDYVIIGDVPYNDDLDPETTGFAFVENLKDQGFKPGDVLTVVGKRGGHAEEPILVDYENNFDSENFNQEYMEKLEDKMIVK